MAESARRGRERHSERKPCLFLGRTNGQFTSVSRCDLGGDVKAQSESLPAGVGIPSKKGLEQFAHRLFRDRFARIRNPEFELVLPGFSMDHHRLVGSSMSQSVPEEI